MKKTDAKKSNFLFRSVLSYLPEELSVGITEYLLGSGTSDSEVSEIRLRSIGASALTVKGRNIALPIKCSQETLREVFKKICDGAVFAHRDDVSRGFVSLKGGIRVGVCGHARYDGGSCVGVSDISALVFRIPSGECSFARSLYRDWQGLGGSGMLICSRAGEGKTTAIRALAGLIGSGENPRRVVVVDERCEFLEDTYEGAHVDVLRGYRRALGVEIAVRTMSAQIVMVDEISSLDDSKACASALGAGTSVIATVHAQSLTDAIKRDYVKRLVYAGLFDSVCVIKRDARGFSYTLERVELDMENSHGVGDICLI